MELAEAVAFASIETRKRALPAARYHRGCPAASSGASSPLSAATASVRMGMRAARKAPHTAPPATLRRAENPRAVPSRARGLRRSLQVAHARSVCIHG